MTMIQHPTSTKAGSQRLDYIDSLRGLAALYVVLFHVARVPKPPLSIPAWLHEFIGFGGSGVTLFFVISGFSMALTWGRHARSTRPYLSFYAARFFRIAPLFYLILFVTIIRDLAFKGSAGLHSLAEISSNILLVFNLLPLPYQTGIVWASWTIGVECVFYLLFPLVARYTSTFARSVIFLISSIALSTVLYHFNYITHNVPVLGPLTGSVGAITHFPIFIFGILVYRTQGIIGDVRRIRFPLATALALVTISIGGLATMLATMRGTPGASWLYLSALLYSILLLGFSISPMVFLVNPVTTFTGRISYSLYLIHPNVVFALSAVFAAIYRTRLNSTLSFTLSVLLTLIVIFPLSYLTYTFIERPMMRFGKTLFG